MDMGIWVYVCMHQYIQWLVEMDGECVDESMMDGCMDRVCMHVLCV